MAARLVWLVANGLVVPHRVLGLTFTRKAAAELGQRVRARLAGLRRAGLLPSPDGLVAGPRRPMAAAQMVMSCRTVSRSCPPTTPTLPGWSPTTRCARRWSRRCA